MKNKGKYWETETKRFYNWEELMEFYKTKSKKSA